MKIEKVSTADAEKLLAIYAPYVEETAISFEYEVPSVDVFRNRIEQISAKYPYIKAVVDGKIAGYAYAAGFKDRKAYDWSVETTKKWALRWLGVFITAAISLVNGTI